MRNVLEWIWTKIRLVSEFAEDKEEFDEKPYVFFKKIWSYEDGKEIIENYKIGAVCIFYIDSSENLDAQGLLNYICGGVYALYGEVADLGKGVFVVV